MSRNTHAPKQSEIGVHRHRFLLKCTQDATTRRGQCTMSPVSGHLDECRSDVSETRRLCSGVCSEDATRLRLANEWLRDLEDETMSDNGASSMWHVAALMVCNTETAGRCHDNHATRGQRERPAVFSALLQNNEWAWCRCEVRLMVAMEKARTDGMDFRILLNGPCTSRKTSLSGVPGK